LAIFVRVVLTVPAEMPVSLAISEAVIGFLPYSAARILAWFWPRGAGARLASAGRVAARPRECTG